MVKSLPTINWPLSRRILQYGASLVVMVSFIMNGYFLVKAEQVGSSPESGSTSRIKVVYDSLSSSGYGSDTDTPNWGNYWNRIKTAATWVPNGDATAEDVASGKTFFNSTRTAVTGTATSSLLGGCSTQTYDDLVASTTETDNCSLTWTTANSPVTGDDNRAGRGGKDPRTGLIWSQRLLKSGTTVGFSSTTGTNFSWDTSAAANKGMTAPVAGDRTAIQLCADQGNGWRLPSQKELLQAYIDGSNWNLTQPTTYYWSSTQAIAGTNSWFVTQHRGSAGYVTYNTLYGIRCVRSDS